MDIWVVIFSFWGYEYDEYELYYFLSEDDAKKKKNELSASSLSCYSVDIMQCKFEELKDTMTILDFEELFGKEINPLITNKQ